MVASFIPRRVRGVAGGALVLVALAGVSACGTNDGVKQTVTMVGSDTTQDVMAAIANQYDGDNTYNPSGEDDSESVLAIVSAPDPGDAVPGDAVTSCGNKVYRTPTSVPTEVTRPNGSGAGRDALLASVQAGDGCIDVARSSSGPRAIGTAPGSDLTSFEYYAYALDAVGATTASTHIPADHDLTLAELQGIYNCTITNWSAIGGTAGPIQRYWPQAGSGTRTFAQSDLLGFDPTTISSASCPAVKLSQENTGAQIVANGDQATAVYVYSVANWVAMSKGTITDDRGGQGFFDLNGLSPVRPTTGTQFEARTPTAADPAGPVAEANVRLVDPTPAYPGVRFVFNVIDNSTGANSYTPAKRFVGFDNVASPTITSPLCNGDKASTLSQFGFGPLGKTADPTHNIPGTACRLY
jgi:phosphate transport system substrate-binding protein